MKKKTAAKNKKAFKKPGKKFTGKKRAAKKSFPKKKIIAKKLVAKKTIKPVFAPRKKAPNPFVESMYQAVMKVLDERQAEDIVTVDLFGKSSMADYMVIASGRAARQIGAIAHYLREAFQNLGIKQIRVEGLGESNWVVVDGGDIIIHLFRPEVRRYYNLEDIWQNGTVDRDAVMGR